MWSVWAEEEYLTHHTKRKFNFDRLLYIKLFMTYIHRVRFVSINGEASRGIDFFQNFFLFRIRIRIKTSIRISLWNSLKKSYSLYTKDTHQIWCHSAKLLWKSKFCSGSGSWFYFGFQYQTYISYIEDTHQILFGSANFFESYCVHSKSPRTVSQSDRQTDRRRDIRTDGRIRDLSLNSFTTDTTSLAYFQINFRFHFIPDFAPWSSMISQVVSRS